MKQRPATETEILLLAQRLQKNGVGRALALAFAQGKALLDPEALREKAAGLYGIERGVFLKPSQLLREAVRWAQDEVPVLWMRSRG